MVTSAPQWAAVVSSWTFSPVTDASVAFASIGYLLLVRRWNRTTDAGRWPTHRAACWALAMATVVMAVNSPVGVYGEILFWVHMVQHLMLIMVAPVLLVWAQPLRLTRGPASGTGGARSKSQLWRWASTPLVGVSIYAAVVVLTHLTGFQQLAATHEWVRTGELALYLASGYLLFFPLAGSEPVHRSVPYLVRFVVLALSMGVDTLTGVALMLTSRPLAPVYAAAHPGWGPDPLADQQLAGGIMWWGGDALMMALMIAVAIQWGSSNQERDGLGEWLEGARRRALLGEQTITLGDDVDVDDDQRALDAYNAMLAQLRAER